MKAKLMMMAAVVAVVFGAWAETETVGGYTWTYRINGGTADIQHSVAFRDAFRGALVQNRQILYNVKYFSLWCCALEAGAAYGRIEKESLS